MTTPQTTPLTYNGYVTQIANMAVVDTTTVSSVVQGTDPAFNITIPQMLNYAELRIQRDLDLLPSQTSRTYSLTIGNNQLQISSNDFVTIQTIEINSNGVVIPLLPSTKEFLQNVYGSSTSTSIPAYFAMYGGDLSTGGNTYNNLLVGPYPDANYGITITGTVRLPTLYQSATTALAPTGTTFISTYFPDLLIQASMIYIAQYQRNFGQASNDPSMGPTYELQYQNLLRSAAIEEGRKKFSAAAWSSMSPAVAATPSR
tara:strand:+ start:1703 stop:2476 length:774 start_codon:yes stop_codon:yes gene_type:complete